MLTAFGPNPATMFLSWRGGARAAVPPRQDDFREVFQSRLLSRLSARKQAAQAATSRGQYGETRVRSRNQAKAGESGLRAALRSWSGEARQTAGPEGRQPRAEAPKTRRQDDSPATAPGLAAQASQSAGPRAQQGGATAANPPPQALQDLIAFLQALPNGAMQIPPEKIQAVAAYLLNAGLPQEEVQGLLLSPDLAEQGLSAADLQAAWQRTQGQAAAAAIVPRPGAESTAQQFQPGLNLAPETQEMLQSQEYRARWERALLPESAVPALRLALARLGCSPQDLAQLEEEAQGRGLSLKQVWQVLQQAQTPVSQTAVTPQNQPGTGENPSPAELLAKQPVTGEELAQWRQLLLKAGVEPEAVDKMLGQQAPTSQEDLKTTLLALAPPEEPSEALSEPKPLYLPHNLRLRPLFPQAQSDWDPSELMNGQGNGDQQSFGPASEWAAANGETFVLPAITGELPMFNANLAGTAALSSTSPLWNPVAPEVRESLWSQLQSGIMSNLQPGENQVSLRLNPPELGQIQLTLQLSGQDLAVTAVAGRPEVAELAAQGVQQLLQALAQQGLVLTHFQVRLQDQPQVLTTTNMAGGRDKSSGDSGEKPQTAPRRRSGEVDRFV